MCIRDRGACPHCHGKGVVVTELVFMDPVTTVCEVCEGKRYSEEALSYQYQGKHIAQIMAMSVDEALPFFCLLYTSFRIIPIRSLRNQI